MAEKTLNAYVVLGGKIDGSFQQLGQNLVNLGGSIDGISQKLINFGKESVKTYRSYEDSMLEAEVALSTNYGRGTKALNEVMGQLDRQASEWAATTIFHTDDVANAIAEAAHANWDLDKILEGMPAAMKLAQAGSLDLSTGLDYIIKSTNAAGISFGDLNEWIDEWTYAANSSAGDVEQFGEAMLKMGNTMRFADNKEELLTMLAVLHDAGTTGSNGGTLLRNSMIRLVAPTAKASKAMAELSVTQEEIDEAMGETNGKVAEAVATLEAAGFSAYDSSGNLKDFTEIFEDLNKATKGMSEEAKYDIWSAIFPTRTITGAMALIEAADKNWNGLLDDLNAGKAAGYGDYASETMMSGLTGSIETFNSKIEDLRKEVGEQLAPQLETVLGNLGKVVDLVRNGGQDNGVSSGLDWITSASELIGSLADSAQGMDPALFDAISSALGSIATLGPALLIGGLAIRGIGNAMALFTGSKIGMIILAAAGLATLNSAIQKYQEAKFLENFGDLQIDTAGLDEKLQAVRKSFEEATKPTNDFAKALEDCVTNYNTASSTLSATMIQDLLTGQTLTGDELEKKLAEYETLGSQMVEHVKAGITASADMSAEFWMNLLGGRDGMPENAEYNSLYEGINKLLTDEKSEALLNAESIGEALKKSISDAWADGHLDETERENIKEYFRQLSEAMAEAEREAQSEADFIRRKKMMDKAQGMDYTQMSKYVNETIAPQRQEELDWYEDHFKAEMYRLEYRRDKAKEEGDYETAAEYDRLINGWDDETGHHAGANEAYANARAGIFSDYDQMIMSWYAATLGDSDFREGIPALQQAAAWLMSGQVTNENTLRDYMREHGATDTVGLTQYYEAELKALGASENIGQAIEEVKRRIEQYSESDDVDLQKMGQQLESILAIYSLLSGTLQENYGDLIDYHEIDAKEFESLYKEGFFGQMLDSWLKSVQDEDFFDNPQVLNEMRGNLQGAAGDYLQGAIRSFGDLYDLDMIAAALGGGELPEQFRSDFALAKLLGMSEEERQQYTRGGTESNLWQAERDAEAKQAAYDAALDTFYNHPISGSYHTGMEPTADIKALGEAAEAAWAVVEELGGTRPGEAPQTEAEATLSAVNEETARAALEGLTTAIAEAENMMPWINENAETQFSADEIDAAYEALYGAINEFGERAGGLYDAQKELEAYVELQEQAEAEGEAAWGGIQTKFDTPITGIIELSLKLPTLPTGMTWTGWTGMSQMAEGGRETKPTIFAEAGKPEWYIPEEHTPNTAKLLAAAAANSGFNLLDLAQLSGARLFAEGGTDGGGDTGASLDWGSLPGGGTNDGSGSGGDGGSGGDITVQYSPVIHADNADGVEKKLKEDKARFEKWFNEFMEKRQMYQSMVAYQ